MYFYLSDFSDGLFKFYHKVFHTLGGNDDLAYRPSREIQSVGIYLTDWFDQLICSRCFSITIILGIYRIHAVELDISKWQKGFFPP